MSLRNVFFDRFRQIPLPYSFLSDQIVYGGCHRVHRLFSKSDMCQLT